METIYARKKSSYLKAIIAWARKSGLTATISRLARPVEHNGIGYRIEVRISGFNRNTELYEQFDQLTGTNFEFDSSLKESSIFDIKEDDTSETGKVCNQAAA